jgi:hypothetical protein
MGCNVGGTCGNEGIAEIGPKFASTEKNTTEWDKKE